MARTWLSIRVELVDGAHAPALWPRPGRVLLAAPDTTFRALAEVVDEAFARWDRGHLHEFVLDDGTRIGPREAGDDGGDGNLDDTVATLARLQPGERFAYEFDLGDGWTHLCTVGDERFDPAEVLGDMPDRPVPYDGWGSIPDQYGRRCEDDEPGAELPPAPDPPLGDLPGLHPTWGTAVRGPWPPGAPAPSGWTGESVVALRRAVAGGDVDAAVELLAAHDPSAVAHLAAPVLLRALGTGHGGATAVADGIVSELSLRGWLGDGELVDELDRVAQGLEDLHRPVTVDLDELADHLDGGGGLDEGVRLELATGRFWLRDPEGMAGEPEPDDLDDPDAFVTVMPLGSRPAYGDMRAFVATVSDERLAQRLADALGGRGAFRRFRDVLHHEEQWEEAWSTWRAERRLARGRWWLADVGYRPALPGEGVGRPTT